MVSYCKKKQVSIINCHLWKYAVHRLTSHSRCQNIGRVGRRSELYSACCEPR